ncbi:AsmA-like C-terminal region-containing protein [Luteolibacter sp. Populi]|uniref:AsmA-like C-terminal region-containing protein n=1 Tax=Luteolibacter sp. Populi TaxID=3230487 RepID=UPI003465C2F4
MRHIRLIHKLRTLLALLVFAALLAAGGGLWWANRTGLPESWRGEIEKALAAQGLHADIGQLRYWPLQGIEADEVKVYSDATHSRVIARASEVIVDVDRTKLARGKVRVERLDLKGGSLTLPVDPDDPDSKMLEVKNAAGRVLMPGGRRLEILGARGEVSGIRLEFEALLLGYRQRLSDKPEDKDAELQRRRLLSRVIGLLEPWRFEEGKPPLIRMRVEGDLDDPKSVRADVFLKSGALERGGIRISRVEARGEVRGRLLVLDSLDLDDDGGSLKGRMEYDLSSRSGRFEMHSNLDLPPILREFDAGGLLSEVGFQSRPELTARGKLEWPEDKPPSFHIMGHLAANNVNFAKHTAARLESDVSFDGKNLFLDNLVATRPDGQVKARVLVKDDEVRYSASTNLRATVWRDFFDKVPLGKVLHDFSETDGTTVDGSVEGRASRSDPHDWDCGGTVTATHMAYKGTPFNRAQVTMKLDHEFLDFTDGTVEFDYSGYAMRKAHGGPQTGKAKVARVRYNRAPSTLTLEGIEGSFWPAPVLRMFLPEVADHLEQYGFHNTPALRGSGTIGLQQAPEKTDFKIHGTTPGKVSYHFAGTDLLLAGLETDVRVKPGRTEVRDLSFDLFDGPVRSNIDVVTSGVRKVTGEIDWTRLSLGELSTACGFEKQAKGFVTGRMDFVHHGGGETAGLNGEGHIALEEGELFSVPIFGPLSPLLSAVVDRKAGFQQATAAFCTFKVVEGVLRTRDFYTDTSSLVFTGDGSADLNRKWLDMTIRMNARGLLGIITLPLKPVVDGLFQFRGTGPLKEPKWDNVMFTSPPEEEIKRLTAPPKATRTGPANRR